MHRLYITAALLLAAAFPASAAAGDAPAAASGVMTFVVGPRGVVYQKDLDDQTAEIARAMTAYDSDESWYPARDD